MLLSTMYVSKISHLVISGFNLMVQDTIRVGVFTRILHVVAYQRQY